jgi:hypothetical protein
VPFALNTLREKLASFLNFSPASGETRVRAQAVETVFNSLLELALELTHVR